MYFNDASNYVMSYARYQSYGRFSESKKQVKSKN